MWEAYDFFLLMLLKKMYKTKQKKKNMCFSSIKGPMSLCLHNLTTN
jgi:hypothetical protein